MKVLISSQNSFNLDQMVLEGFKKNNVCVELSPWPKYSDFNQLKLLLYKFKTRFYSDILQNQIIADEQVKEYNLKLFNKIIKNDYDILFVMQGDMILPQFFEKIIEQNKQLKILLWCTDPILKFKNILKTAKYYDLVYAFEPTDIPDLKKYNVDTRYLPLAYDPEIFFPMNDGVKEYDISFVCHLGSNRKKLLDELLRERKDLKMKIWGKQWSWLQPANYLDYQLHRYRVKNCLNNYDITPNEANKIYNISKICFNNHIETTKTGINPRFFEIFGSGAFQLVDYKPVLDTLFDYNCKKFCYRNRNELLEKIQYYIENEKERGTIANDMNKIIENGHTYYHRIKEILKDIKL